MNSYDLFSSIFFCSGSETFGTPDSSFLTPKNRSAQLQRSRPIFRHHPDRRGAPARNPDFQLRTVDMFNREAALGSFERAPPKVRDSRSIELAFPRRGQPRSMVEARRESRSMDLCPEATEQLAGGGLEVTNIETDWEEFNVSRLRIVWWHHRRILKKR